MSLLVKKKLDGILMAGIVGQALRVYEINENILCNY